MEEENKKLLFLFVFSTYLSVFLLKFQPEELPGCEIKLCIQWVPTRHTFDRPLYPKNNKYLKIVMMSTHSTYSWRTSLPQKQEIPEKTWWWHSKVCWVGTHWMWNLILHPMISLDRKLSKTTGRYIKNTNKKVVFFMILIPNLC